MPKFAKMNIRYISLLLSVMTFISCSENADKREIEKTRDVKKKEVVFTNINNAWKFNTQPVNATTEALAISWNEWRVFLNELSQKPQSTIGAFRKKAQTLSLKVVELNNNIPVLYSKPEVKSRIAVLTSKINSLNLYISLADIPDKKVTVLIGEINIELASLQREIGEIVRKNQIPKEEGELDMIRLLDTSRAVPTNPVKTPVMIKDNLPLKKINK